MFLFLPITLVVYFGLAHRRWTRAATGWLAVASFFFYGWWDVHYVPLLFGSILFNFWAGRRIEAAAQKRPWLLGSMLVNLALLGYFKYTGFFLATLNGLQLGSWDVPHIVLPLGISFLPLRRRLI